MIFTARCKEPPLALPLPGHLPPRRGEESAAPRDGAAAAARGRDQTAPTEWETWTSCSLLTEEGKLKDHHGVKSDVMNALLCINVNPHLCIVGRDHRLPYWNLAQGPAPCQIGLKKRKYKVEEWKWWLPRSTGECIIRTVKVEIVKVLRWKSQVEKKRMNILESESWVT